MNIIAVGMSYRTAGPELLPRITVSNADLPALLRDLVACPTIGETVVLSTGQRTEVYAVAETFHGGLDDVMSVLSQRSGVDAAVLHRHVYVHHAEAAVEHLLMVAAGADSPAQEVKVLRQLRTAYGIAHETGAAGELMRDLSERVLRVGQRVNAETEPRRSGSSVVTGALASAEPMVGGLAGARVLLVGAGSIGLLVAAALQRAGIGEIVIANRTEQRAAPLVKSLREKGIVAHTAGLARLAPQLAAADLVITCTGSAQPVLDLRTAKAAVWARSGRPLVLCDLGFPRDVEDGVAELPGVRLIDLEGLRPRLIVAEEVADYVGSQGSAAVTPTVAALRTRAAEVVDSELRRLDARLVGLEPLVRKELADAVWRVVDTLLPAPAAGSDHAAMLHELFELPDRSNPAA